MARHLLFLPGWKSCGLSRWVRGLTGGWGWCVGLGIVAIHVAGAAERRAVTPPRLARSEAFLGVHFDFHAGPDCTEIGRRTTPDAVAAVLDRVHPDFVQVDGKGHAGYASWPTRHGVAASAAPIVILPAVSEPATDAVAEGARVAGALVRAVADVVPQPSIRLSGAPDGAVEIVTARKGDADLIHLINTSGRHATDLIIDRIDPAGPVAVEWRRAKQPREVTLQPGARRVEWTYVAGVLRVTIPRVDVHEIVVVRE